MEERINYIMKLWSFNDPLNIKLSSLVDCLYYDFFIPHGFNINRTQVINEYVEHMADE